MSLKRLTVFVVITELIGLGIFFAFLLGAVTANGGRMLLDMTQFGEMWPEYAAILILTAVTPYVLYILDDWTNYK
jgi:hypothetical protein